MYITSFPKYFPVYNSNMTDQAQETYDTPKVTVHVNSNYDSPRPWSRTPPAATTSSSIRSTVEESYDVPRPVHFQSSHATDITPSSSNSSLLLTTTSPDSISLSSSNRSSLINMPSEYDIPRKNGQHLRSPIPSMANANSTYAIPQKTRQTSEQITGKELSLELSLALETLAKLQNEATSAVTRYNFVCFYFFLLI